jgi:hypothetical protein
LALTALNGCGVSARTDAPIARELPPAPAFAQRVTVRHDARDDLLTVAGRERAGRAKANDIITCFLIWYSATVQTYRLAAERDAAAALKRCEESHGASH